MSTFVPRFQVYENVLHRLWSEDDAGARRGGREHWIKRLRRLTGWPESKCRAFLERQEMSERDVKDLADHLGLEEEVLRMQRLVEHEDLLKQNLAFLFASLEHGQKGALAEHTGVSGSTVSRWVNEQHPPDRRNLQRLARYFGLPAGTDLRTEALFLSYRPVTLRQRRRVLKERLEALPDEHLRDYLPALEKLLDIS
jgi:transcriptional regulator with XRE-family HTH domain